MLGGEGVNGCQRLSVREAGPGPAAASGLAPAQGRGRSGPGEAESGAGAAAATPQLPGPPQAAEGGCPSWAAGPGEERRFVARK